MRDDILISMSEEIPKIGTGQPGRPTIEEGRRIEHSIKECFAHGLSAAYTIQLTGLNKNTVYAKYKELEDEIREAQATDITERAEKRKLQHDLASDDLMFRVYDVFYGVEKWMHERLDNGGDVPVAFFNMYVKLLEKIQSMQKAKKVHIPEKFEFNGKVYER